MNGDRMGDRIYDEFVGRGVDYGEIARMPLKMMASQIAELRRDARRQEGGERDGYGSSREIARAIRSYARGQEND
jgi:hypothetical protein